MDGSNSMFDITITTTGAKGEGVGGRTAKDVLSPPKGATAASHIAKLVAMGGEAGDESSSTDDNDNKNNEEEDAKIAKDSIFYEECDGGKDFRVPLRLTKSGRRRATPFPIKLMKVLSEKENADIVSWTPSGKAFMILQPKQFCSKILPDEFKSAKFSSFTRKLHRWGFMRHYRGVDSGAFYHKNFQKGRLDLVEKMSCYKPVHALAGSFAPELPEPSPVDDICSRENATAGSEASVAAAAGNTMASPSHSCQRPRTGGTEAEAAFLAAAGLQQQLQQRQGNNPGSLAPAWNAGQAQDLNTAIEVEVARRLKDRLNATALSRHQSSMMCSSMFPHQQQQQQQLMGFAGSGGMPVATQGLAFAFPGTATVAPHLASLQQPQPGGPQLLPMNAFTPQQKQLNPQQQQQAAMMAMMQQFGMSTGVGQMPHHDTQTMMMMAAIIQQQQQNACGGGWNYPPVSDSQGKTADGRNA